MFLCGIQIDNEGDQLGWIHAVLSLPGIFRPSTAMIRLRSSCSVRLRMKCTEAALGSDPLLLQGLRQLLLSVFGDVPAVITCEARRGMFCMLPRAAVFIWAKEDGLKVRSDNRVRSSAEHICD